MLQPGSNIVNPLYNSIRYNSKIRYNVDLVRTKSADRVFFQCYSHVILQENICFVYLLEWPRRGDSNIHKTYDS